MKRVSGKLLSAGLLWTLLGFTCVDDEGDCYELVSSCDLAYAPSTGTLNLIVSKPLPVLVVIYAGASIEDGVVVWSGPPPGEEWSRTLPVGNYSASARYERSGETIIAVDGDYVGYETVDTCEGTCYASDDGDVDLAL
jgi:hypothetical protein